MNIHFMIGLVKGYHIFDGNISHDLRKIHGCFPLVVCQCPARPIFLASGRGVVRLDAFAFYAGLIKHLIGKLHTGHANNNSEIASFKAFCNAGLDEQVEEFSNIVFEIIHRKVQHTAKGSASFVKINLIVGADHRASSPHLSFA